MYDRAGILEAITKLNVWTRGDRRAPHKPLLLLVALGQLVQGRRSLPFDEVEERLLPLLDEYAPPKRGKHQPMYPYWHLRSDGLWVVPGVDELPKQMNGIPRMNALRGTEGSLPADVAATLLANRGLLAQVVQELLDRHFADSLHDSLREATGLEALVPPSPPLAAEAGVAPLAASRSRDPEFRRLVLRAYEHRCAATGFRAALGGRGFFGVQAAHLKWHALGGPDIVGNGLVLDPTMHMLLDRGAWSLTDDRRILVSAQFTGSDEAVGRLRTLHGKPLKEPLPGCEPVRREFIRWHREPDKGGVFRQPALGEG
jgi:putative restriction endonuclease